MTSRNEKRGIGLSVHDLGLGHRRSMDSDQDLCLTVWSNGLGTGAGPVPFLAVGTGTGRRPRACAPGTRRCAGSRSGLSALHAPARGAPPSGLCSRPPDSRRMLATSKSGTLLLRRDQGDVASLLDSRRSSPPPLPLTKASWSSRSSPKR